MTLRTSLMMTLGLVGLMACETPRPDDVALQDQLEEGGAPCRAKVQYHELDFMLGDWIVRTREGRPVGTSRFEVVSQGCAVLESTTQGAAYSGQGLHYFDPGLGKWRQAWTDSGGGTGELIGGFRDGAMRYEGIVHNSQGEETPVRGAFLAQGSEGVKQIGESTPDGGRTWQTQFEFFYERNPGPPVDYERAVQTVLEIDRVIAGQRNLATEHSSLQAAITAYLRGLDAIEFGLCPPEFTQAFHEHRNAWETALSYFAGHPDLRGEMHALFDRLRVQEPEELAAHERAIRDTWSAIEAIAQQYSGG